MSQVDVLCVIPARLESTRLPKKLLRTVGGKPILQFVYENAKKAKGVSRVLVACDHESIKSCVEGFGGEAMMTSVHHTSGTERIAEVAGKIVSSIVVNVQGDEPLMNAQVIGQVIQALKEDSTCQVSTACIRKNDAEEFSNPNVVKVVKDQNGYALYFSRAPIPHDREKKTTDYLKHLGIYGYTRDFLLGFSKLKASKLEEREKLEQLRVLENGYKIKVVETVFDSIGVDTEADLKQVEEKILGKGLGASHA